MKTAGIKDALSADSLAVFDKAFRAARRDVPPDERMPAAAQVELFGRLAMRDKDVRRLYQMEARSQTPSTFEDAIYLPLLPPFSPPLPPLFLPSPPSSS